MSVRTLPKLLLAFTLFAAPIVTFAETVWLTDVLWVNVRTGPSDSNRILKTVKSGTRMEVLEKPEDAKFYRIRTENGLEGWIPSRYLSETATGSIRANNLEAEKQQLQQQLSTLDGKYKSLLADKGDVSGELETLRTDNAQLSKELNRIKAVSDNALNLDAQYRELAEQHASVKNELDVMRADNRSLKESNESTMLYIGGLLIIVGIILGFVLPRLGGKRRKDGWS